MMKLLFEIKAPINSVWLALTDTELIKDWSGAAAEIDLRVDGAYSLWGGDVYGRFLAFDEPKTLVQEWTINDWPKPSTLTINLEEVDGGITRVYLEQEHIPLGHEEDVEAGWDEYYFSPIKKLLEQ